MGTYNGAALGHQPDVRQHSRGGSENENRCNAIILKSLCGSGESGGGGRA